MRILSVSGGILPAWVFRCVEGRGRRSTGAGKAALVWEPGKVSRAFQEFHAPDGTVVAEVESISGLLDLESRRLVADPGRYWRKYATRPEILGLDPDS
jgi:hypothetical protein